MLKLTIVSSVKVTVQHRRYLTTVIHSVFTKMSVYYNFCEISSSLLLFHCYFALPLMWHSFLFVSRFGRPIIVYHAKQ